MKYCEECKKVKQDVDFITHGKICNECMFTKDIRSLDKNDNSIPIDSPVELKTETNEYSHEIKVCGVCGKTIDFYRDALRYKDNMIFHEECYYRLPNDIDITDVELRGIKLYCEMKLEVVNDLLANTDVKVKVIEGLGYTLRLVRVKMRSKSEENAFNEVLDKYQDGIDYELYRDSK